jgi:hypothetical protein
MNGSDTSFLENVPRYGREERRPSDTPATFLNISEAARRAGVARTTLYRDIKKGKVSATLMHDGTRGIDLSELLRAYGSSPMPKVRETQEVPIQPNTETKIQFESQKIQLEADLRVEQSRVAMLEEQLAESRKREDWQRQQIDRLLTHQATPTPEIDVKQFEEMIAVKGKKKRRQKLRGLLYKLLGEES